jgi:hypothetical protein
MDIIMLALDIHWQIPAVFARNKISIAFNLDMIEKGYRSCYLVQTNCVALHVRALINIVLIYDRIHGSLERLTLLLSQTNA